MINEQKKGASKDACYSKVKSRYSVWPSAYASGALVKCRKVGAANWGNSKKKNESIHNAYFNFAASLLEAVSAEKKAERRAMQDKATGTTEAERRGETVRKDQIKRDKERAAASASGRKTIQVVQGANAEKNREAKEKAAGTSAGPKDSNADRPQKPEKPTPNKNAKARSVVGRGMQRAKSSISRGRLRAVAQGRRELAGLQFQHTKYQRIGSIIAEKSAAWTRKEGKNPSGGLNAKGVASYRAKNPGSKLKTAVTTKPSKLKKGSKAASRRKSFCARMSGMRKRQNPKNNTGKDRLSLSLKKWNC